MSLLFLYLRIEEGVYPSSVPSCLFLRMSSSKRPDPDIILGFEVIRCSIGVVRCVVQVIQNWFTGITIPTRSSRLG